MDESTGRVIKRYANRKLYDTRESRYVTLDQIADMIRQGEDVKVVDNNTKEDLTSVTLAQIIFEEEKKRHSFLPLGALRKIIESGGESLHEFMNHLTESAERVGRVFRHEGGKDGKEGKEGEEPTAEAEQTQSAYKSDATRFLRDFMEGVQNAIDEWQHKLDSSVHAAMESVSPLAPIQKEVQALGDRLAELERKLTQAEGQESPPSS